MAETNAFPPAASAAIAAKTSISTDRVQQRFFCLICDHQFIKNSPEDSLLNYRSYNRYTGVQ